MRHVALWKIVAGLACLAMLSGLLAACGGDDDDDAAGDAQKIGIVMPNFKNDGSFGQATYEGMLEAERQFDVEGTVVEGVTDPAETLRKIRDLARDNDLVLGTSTAQVPAIVAAAKQFPDVHFAITDSKLPEKENTSYTLTDWHGPGFVAGALAAAVSKTETVGFIGGALIPPITQGRDGYEAGAKSVNSSIKVLKTITGDFTDPVKARDAASSQIAAGADVIWGETDEAFAGIITAIETSGKEVATIGAISPKCEMAKGRNLGDTLLNQTQIVVDIVRNWVEGKPANVVYNLQEPAVQSFRFCEGKETPELTTSVEKATEEYRASQPDTE
jgi:basic membrane protein A and related proteins